MRQGAPGPLLDCLFSFLAGPDLGLFGADIRRAVIVLLAGAVAGRLLHWLLWGRSLRERQHPASEPARVGVEK